MGSNAPGALSAPDHPGGYDVFISHKSEHRPWVEWLGRSLIANGRSVFLDIWNLVPGESWVDGLHRGLASCRAALLIATPEVVNSGWVREEYYALQKRRQGDSSFRLIPVVFGDLPNLPFLGNLQAVDCRDAGRYREWFHRLLCGLDGREPGHGAMTAASINPPPALRVASADDMVPSEVSFVQRVMARVAPAGAPPVIVASRGRRHQGPVIKALLDRARAAYESQHVLHITPPFSQHATQETAFGELGRQCGFARGTPDATGFMTAFEERLDERGPQFLLVSGFEGAAEGLRRELAGALRGLNEHRTGEVRIVLLGGERLVRLKYGDGPLSLLTHAAVEQWPQPGVGDVLAWNAQAFPGRQMQAESARALLAATGGHSDLVRHCLEQSEDAQAWDQQCLVCPALWESWYALAREAADALRDGLARDTFGPDIPWPADPTARRLYWWDLLAARDRKLVWRCEAVRQVGREVLG